MKDPGATHICGLASRTQYSPIGMSATAMDPPTSEETPEQAAQYIAALTQELAALARRAGLETLSQILEMARLEADQAAQR